MKRIVAIVPLISSLCVAWPAAAADMPTVVELWPGNVPDEAGTIGPETAVNTFTLFLEGELSPSAARFHCDENCSKSLVKLLRSRGLDVTSDHQAGLRQESDEATSGTRPGREELSSRTT